jgi:hypothetical protein
MPEFDDMFPKQQPKAPQGIEIDGEFECQHCDERVVGALYDQINSALVWRCKTHGHVSIIKDFKL